LKVKDLIETINRRKEQYGEDFLEFKVFTEQISENDRRCKTTGVQKNWGKIKDPDEWEYFECAGFNTIFEKEKIFTINVNY